MTNNTNSQEDMVGIFKQKLPELPEDTCHLILEQFGWNLNSAFESMGLTWYENPKTKSYEDDCSLRNKNILPVESKSDDWKVCQSKAKGKQSKKNDISAEVFSELFVTSKKQNTADTQGSLIRKYPAGIPKEDVDAILRRELCYPKTRDLIISLSSPGTEPSRTLIIMRGLSGSGKSTLGQLLSTLTETGVKVSADDFFVKNGRYVFNPMLLSDAHKTAQMKCRAEMNKGSSPIIVDNTNTIVKEMLVYAKMAIEFNYGIEVVEPNTPWKYDIKTLVIKNTHNVPREALERMYQRFDKTVTAAVLVKAAGGYRNRSQPSVRESQNGSQDTPASPKMRCLSEYIPISLPCPNPAPVVSKSIETEQNCKSPFLTSSTELKALCVNSINNESRQSEYNSLPVKLNPRRAAIFPSQSDVETHLADDCRGDNVQKFKNNDNNEDQTLFCSDVQIDQCDPSVNEQDAARQYLMRIFPSQPLDLLEEYLQSCGGDINYCCDLLLEGGYGEATRVSPPVQQNISRSHSNSPDNLEDMGAVGGIDVSSSSASTFVSSGEDDHLKCQDTGNGASNMSFAPWGQLKDDLYVPIDGDDWIDLQLPPEFVGNLIEKYSNPIAGTDLAVLPENFLKIKVPPKIAFKLFQLLSLNVMQNDYYGMSDVDVQQQIDADAKYAAFIAQHDVDDVDFEPTLLKISDLEVKGKFSQLTKAKECRDQIHVTFASILKLHKLQSTFPGLPKSVVQDVLVGSNENFEKALDNLKITYPSHFYAPGLSEIFELKEQFRQTIDQQLETLQQIGQDYSPEPEEITGPDWRDLSMKHYKLRQEYQEKVQAASQQNMPYEVARHYASMSAMHNQKMKFANSKAKDWYLMYFNQDGATNKLDLHCQTTKDALHLLNAFLLERLDAMKKMNKRKAVVQIITGRGNNSVDGVARLHPAVKDFLIKRNLRYSEDVGQYFVYLTRG